MVLLLLLKVQPCLVFFHPMVMVMLFTFVLPSTSVLRMSMAVVATKTVARRTLRLQLQDFAFMIVSPPPFKDLPQCCTTDEGTTYQADSESPPHGVVCQTLCPPVGVP